MPDISDRYLTDLRAARIEGLNLEQGQVLPSYHGASILNLPATFCQLLDVPVIGSSPLNQGLMSHLASLSGGRVDRIVTVLVDSLSHHRLQRWSASDDTPPWRDLTQDGILLPLTSVTPSTTSAALPTLWSGRSPLEHGNLGYELWLKEYGVVANMVTHSVFTFKQDSDGLRRAGFEAESSMPFPTLGPHLKGHGVGVYAFLQNRLIHSGLSKMNQQGVEAHGFFTPADLWIGVRTLLEKHPGERLYVWAYWGEVDSLSHLYGPDDERPMAEFAHFSNAFARYFLSALSPAARRGTLLLLLSDHGQITTRKNPRYDLRHHPGLTRRLHLLPTGENRLAYLFVRPGQMEAVREYLERTWPNQFTVLNSQYAAEAGMFGPGKPHPLAADRLGDLLVIARGDAYLWWGRDENPIIGRHGGLSLEEMLVPLLAVWLD